MPDVVKTPLNIRVQYIFIFLADAAKDSFNGIVGGATWTKSIAIYLELCLPFWFKRELCEHLSCAFRESGNA